MTDKVIDMPQDGDLGAKIDRLDRKVDVKIDRLDAKFDEKFEKIDAKFEKIDEKFEKVDEKFEKLGAKFDAKIDRLGTELRGEGQALRMELTTKIDGVSADLGKLYRLAIVALCSFLGTVIAAGIVAASQLL